jgi:AcrR family transcriptional regulator
VNLAAVHYHFGSKEALLNAVIARLVEPVNRERLAMLGQCEARAGKGRPRLRKIVEAFLTPALRLSQNPERGATVQKLLGRLLSEPEFFERVIPEQFGEVLERFVGAICRALPRLPPGEIIWRLHYGIGAMAHTMCIGPRMHAVTEGLVGEYEPERNIRRLIEFMVAGLKAPMAEVKR